MTIRQRAACILCWFTLSLCVVAQQEEIAGAVQAEGSHPARTAWAIAVHEASINSYPLRACIDTGADVNVAVDTEVLQHLGVSINGTQEIQTPLGATNIDVYSSVVASVSGGASLSVTPVGLDARTVFGTEYRGFQAVLGLEYLSGRVVVIDSGQVSMHTMLPSKFNTFDVIKTGDSAKELVHCDLLVEGHGTARVRIDTGQSNACRMKPQLIESLKQKQICVDGLRTETRTISGVRIATSYILAKRESAM